MSAAPVLERHLRFRCFGTTVSLRGPARPGGEEALSAARALLLEVHAGLSRFEPGSELSRLNRDPRPRVPASPLLRRFALAVRHAGEGSGGLVDATCLDAVEAAGYTAHLDPLAPAAARVRTPTTPAPLAEAWAHVDADHEYVTRPPGVRLDSGGLGKGLAADLAAELLVDQPSWAVDCGGDLRVGGRAGRARTIEVSDPREPGRVLHTLRLARGAVATSGTTRRSWRVAGTEDGSSHHLIDPRTGAPADTGIVQVTALAATGLEAEARAKAALLRGPDGAASQLRHGGVILAADGTVVVI